jgi:hypothetical protein
VLKPLRLSMIRRCSVRRVPCKRRVRCRLGLHPFPFHSAAAFGWPFVLCVV